MKKILFLLFFGVVQFCQAEPRSFPIASYDSSGQGFLTSMQELNKSALNQEISGAIAKILGAVIGKSVGYAYRTTRNGVYATTDFFFPNAARLRRKKEMEIDQTERALASSLAIHLFEKKNAMGMPCACEELVEKYEAIAGKEALARMQEIFRGALKELAPEEFVSELKA